MAFTGGDKTWVVYQGPPKWDGSQWVNGDRFFLSGHHAFQGKNGVELAPGVTGLERGTSEYRYDTSANIPGAKLISTIDGRREVSGSINILGSTAAEVRKNKNNWFANHPDREPGRLWFFTSDSMPRYLYAVKSEGAGLTTLEKDPSNRNLYEKFEWGWVSDDAFFKGYRETKILKDKGRGEYSRTFFNTSTVPEVFPTLFLPGGVGASWRISMGYGQPDFITPAISSSEEIRIDFDPTNPTFVKRHRVTGDVTNLWPLMVGKRPRFSLEAQTMNTFTAHLHSGSADTSQSEPRLVFTPLYTSWN